MGFIEDIISQARKAGKRIVLPEGTEERTVKAAELIAKQGIAEVILLASETQIGEKTEKLKAAGVRIIDVESSAKLETYAKEFFEIRKKRCATLIEAIQTVKNPLYYACMMIKMGDADGMVAGAINTTANTLRPALQIIKTLPGISVVSSCFIMALKNNTYGDGLLVFGDCAVNPNPDAQQLAAIAVSTAKTAQQLTGRPSRVAMLSFSTKGSAKHELVDKVVNATQIAKQIDPGLMIDGELQADAALVESVGQLKSPGSPVAGKANVLIFPDLQSGNIGYKLVQEIAEAEAFGPICQGFAAPVNDLSRGCSVEDIVSVVAITAVQAI